MIRKKQAAHHFHHVKYLFLVLLVPLLLRADLINTSDTVMILKNMGGSVNTAGDEFYPTITADGKTMVFSLRPPNGENSDIFMSRYKSGSWTRPAPIRELNTGFDDQTPFISADGNFILFSSNRESALRPPKTEGGVYYLTNDLYITRREGGRWTEPEWIDGEVNTIDNERAPSLSKDGKTLYFSRYQGNSLEKSVIYQATLGSSGFGDVKPLPAPVNSGYSDFALMPSNNKPGFYFSSSRPGGRGLWDIYYVHYIDKKFSEPINLGAPTNSEFNDLTVTEIGNVIYFCSDRDGGKGSTDIYTILLSPKIFNVPDTGFKFTATEKESGRAVSASFRVSLGYADAKKKAGKVLDKKSGADGRFDLKVDPGVKSVRVTSGDARFKPYSKSFTAVAGEMKQALVQLEKREEQIPEPEEDLIVEAEPPVGDYRPVYFNFGSARIRMKEMPYLREIAKKLRADDTLCLRLTGHADSVGRESGNQRLSVRRAVAVKSALIHFGVSRYRFSVAGKGEREPSDLYKDTGKRRYNRRVEFTVIDREQVDDDEEMP